MRTQYPSQRWPSASSNYPLWFRKMTHFPLKLPKIINFPPIFYMSHFALHSIALRIQPHIYIHPDALAFWERLKSLPSVSTDEDRQILVTENQNQKNYELFEPNIVQNQKSLCMYGVISMPQATLQSRKFDLNFPFHGRESKDNR